MDGFQNRWREILICLLLAAATLTAYWPTRNYGFVEYDDQDYVTENVHVRSGLNRGSVAWAFTHSHSGNWHPLTWMSLMLDCQLFGQKMKTGPVLEMKAGPMHIHNALLHAANACLLFWVLRRMTGALWTSAFAAALFAWHPLRVESVAWVTERKDVLSTFFWLLTMAAWQRFTERRNACRYGLALLAFALGLMSKSMLVTLPCVLVLLDFWPLRRHRTFTPAVVPPPDEKKKRTTAPPPPPVETGLSWPRLLLEKTPFFLLTLAVASVTFFTQRGGGAMNFGDSIPKLHRLANALVAYSEYLRKLFWPDDLAVFYPHPGLWPLWRIGIAAVVVAALTALALWQRRSRPYLLTGWLWYLGTLVPVLGLVQVGGQAFADRYTYVPILGIGIMLAWGLADLAARWKIPRTVASFVVVGLLLACLAGTAMQVRHWENTMTLFDHALKVTQKNHRAHKAVADVFTAQKNYPEANRHYEEALRIKPYFLGAHVNYGIALVNQGKLDAAIPRFEDAVKIDPKNAEAHNNLGAVYEMRGRYAEAIQQYRQALAARPNYATAQKNLEKLLARQQKSKAAATP